MSENNIVLLIKQQFVKEQIKKTELSHLTPDFYRKINRYRMKLDKEELKQIDSIVKQIMRMRIGKILMLIDQDGLKNIKDSLADEECLFWEKISNAQNELKKSALQRVMI